MAERVTVSANDARAGGAGLLAAVGLIFVAVCGGSLGFAIHEGKSRPTELIVGLCVSVASALVGLVLAITLWKDTTYTVEDDALVERRWRHERRIPWSAIRDMYLTMGDTAVVVPSDSPPLRFPVESRGRDALLREVLARSSDAPFRRHGERAWAHRDEWPITFTCAPWRRAEAPLWFSFAVVLPVGMIACGLSDGSLARPDASLVARAFGPLFWLSTPMVAFCLWQCIIAYRARGLHRDDVLVADVEGVRFADGARVVASAWRDLVCVTIRRTTAITWSVTITTPETDFTVLTDDWLTLHDLLGRHAPDAVARGVDEAEARDDLGPAPDGNASTYHFRRRDLRLLFALVAVPTGLFSVALWWVDAFAQLRVVGLFAASLVVVTSLALSVRVTLDDRGITRRRVGRATFVAWSDITHVEPSLLGGLVVRGDGVRLRLSATLSRFSLLHRTILRRAPKDALA